MIVGSGLEQRLRALDLVLPVPPVIDPDVRAIVAVEVFAASLGHFQRNLGLEVTAELDAVTRDALVDAHGA